MQRPASKEQILNRVPSSNAARQPRSGSV